jgi:hypothetical protein
MSKLTILSHLTFAALAALLSWHVATDYAELNAYRMQSKVVTAGGNELNKALINAIKPRGQ